MEPENSSHFNVTAEDIRKYPWQELLSAHSDRNCQTYYQVYGRAATRHHDSGDNLGERVYSLLDVVASFFPNFGSEISPYRARRQDSDGSCSLIPDDLANQDLDALHGILHEIEDPEYRARVADVLWTCRKDFKAAHIAVAAFLESAERLKSGDLWPPYVERLDRAALISARRGFEAQRETVITKIESAVLEFENDPQSGLLCGRLMSIILLLKAGDINRYTILSERLAREFAISGEWHFSESYWNVVQNWHRMATDPP